MYKYEFQAEYKIGDEVFRLCDPDKYRYIVTAFFVERNDVLYQIKGTEGTLTVYDIEIGPYEDRLAIIN